uniref:Gustatory receptor n=1 Tax=Stomoxys calcitrans TaxID=35570 RepID=A0A1I8PB21_STOCA
MTKHLLTVQQYCKQMVQFFCIFAGLTSYWYDYKRAQFRRNMLTRLMLVTVNIAALAVIIHEDRRFLMNLKEKAVNPVLKYMATSRFFIILLPPMFTFGQILLSDSKLIELKQRLQSLEMESHTKLVHCKSIERNIGQLYYLKWLLTAFIYCMLVYRNMIEGEWWSMSILYVNMIFLSTSWMFQYFQVLAKICRLCQYFDKHLQKLVGEITNNWNAMDADKEHGLCFETYWLRSKHFELCRLWQELEALSKWLIFFKRLVSLISIGMHIYMAIAELQFFSIVSLIMYDLSDFLPEMLDFYLNDYLCDLAKKTFADLQLTIGALNIMDSTQPKLSREFDVFSLYLCYEKLKFQLAAPLKLGRQTWFAMMSAIATWAIVLGQAHMSAA